MYHRLCRCCVVGWSRGLCHQSVCCSTSHCEAYSHSGDDQTHLQVSCSIATFYNMGDGVDVSHQRLLFHGHVLVNNDWSVRVTGLSETFGRRVQLSDSVSRVWRECRVRSRFAFLLVGGMAYKFRHQQQDRKRAIEDNAVVMAK